ncbi:MAG TPA: hypothetical protein VGC89_10700, partial [Pyrinomonadaceae bacterium]
YQTTLDELERAHAGLVDYHVIPLYPRVAEIFGAAKPFSVLLRPDNYIAYISTQTSLRELREYLSEVISQQ